MERLKIRLMEPTDVPLKVCLLGSIDVWYEGERVTSFESDKARALMVYLLLNARSLRREHLAGLLWGDRPESRARGNLSRVLTNLRHLMPGYLLSDRHTVQFDRQKPYWLDVEVFEDAARIKGGSRETIETLRSATTLYRGEFLEGFSLEACPHFEEWVVVQRERWHRLALRILERLVDLYSRRGEYELSLRYARRSLRLEPWHEATHREIMLITALQGKREEALRQYEACCRILADELGVRPSEETEALYQRILAGNVQPLATDMGAHRQMLPLVGRGESYAWLVTRWEAAQAGEGALTLVAGEAGIGKTRLVEEVLHHVMGQGATVLRGRCYEFSTTVPYQAINEALTAYLISLDIDAVRIPEAVAAELVQILPVVRHLMPDVKPAPQRQDLQARTHLFDSVAYLLRSLPHPVLFLDDLHWADADTLDLVHYLIRSVNSGRFWLVGTYRPEETLLNHPLTRLRQGLSRDALIVEHTLPLLSVGDVRQLVATLVSEEADRQPLATYLLRQSGGNPFALEEVLQGLQAQGVLVRQGAFWRLIGELEAEVLPERVQDVVLRRVGYLSEATRWALNYAALIAQPFAPDLLVKVTGEAPDVIAKALHAGQSHHLLQSTADANYDFVHDRIRETLYQQLSRYVRKLMHERVGQALLDLDGDVAYPSDGLAAQVAHHFERSSAPNRAVPYLLQAAKAAQRAYAHETAIDYYRRLLPLLSEEERFPVVVELIQLWEHLGQWDRAESLIRQTLVMVERLQMHAGAARMWYKLSQIQADQGLYRASLENARRAEAAARRAGSGADKMLAMAINRQAWAHYRLSDIQTALQVAEAGLALSERLAYSRGITASLNLLSGLYNHQGDYATGTAILKQALEIYRREDNRMGEAQILSNLGYTAYQQGNYGDAVVYGKQALPIAQEISIRYVEMLCLTNLGGAEAALGHYPAAEKYLMQVLDYPESQAWFMLTEVYRYLAKVRLGEDDPEAALSLGKRALSLARDTRARKYTALAWRVLAEIAAALPDPPMVVGMVCTPDEGFSKAIEIFTEVEMAGERAWTLWRWARYALKKGEGERGTALAQEARTLAARLGLRLTPLVSSKTR